MNQLSTRSSYKMATRKLSKPERRSLMKKMVRQTLYIGKDYKCSKYYFSKNNPELSRAIEEADKFLEKLEKRAIRNSKTKIVKI